MADVIFEIGGELPYDQRFHAVDLLSWRIAEQIADDPSDYLQGDLLSDDVVLDIIQRVQKARQIIERVTRVQLSLPRGRYGDPRYRFDGPLGSDGGYIPLVPELADYALSALVSHERLAMTASAMALAAGQIDTIHYAEIHSVNPLKINAAITGALGALAVLTVTEVNHITEYRHADPERQVCHVITKKYGELLNTKNGLRSEQGKELGKAFQGCIHSPIFNAAPVQVSLPEGKE